MRQTVIVILVAAIAAFGAFANGNAEKLTTLEGTVVLVPGADVGMQFMVRTANGDVLIEMPVQEMLRLQLREEQHIRVSGVFVGVPTGAQVQARIVARVVAANGQEYSVETPLRLTTRDRSQIRAYEQEQTRLQTRTQLETQTQTQARDGEGSPSSPGSGGTGKK